MMTIRRAADRGHADHGWLKTRHTFSFADYHDPRHMGFRALRVINDDLVAPKGGFPSHPHADMEIVTYPVTGAIAHKDSMGTGSIVPAGEVQRMTAGTGVVHSEYNPSETEWLRLLQIWIIPEKRGIEPGYEQKAFPRSERKGRLRLIGSRGGEEGSVTIHQDVQIFTSLLSPGEVVRHQLAPGRHAWVQVVRGGVCVKGEELEEGDGAALSDLDAVTVEGSSDSEVLLFDLA